MKVGVYVEASNLFFCLKKSFKKKLDYTKLMEFVQSFGPIKRAIVYGAQIGNQADRFIKILESVGFETRYKDVKQFQNRSGVRRKADWDVGISIDIVKDILAKRVDYVILCSADGDFEPVVTWVREQGMDVIILAHKISRELREAATEWIEIPNSLFEESARATDNTR